MTRVHIICEGQTEAAFVQELLQPHFSSRSLFLMPSLIGKAGSLKFEPNSLRRNISMKRYEKNVCCLMPG